MMPENFFEGTILQLFDDLDLHLNEEQKRRYVPQFQTQLERRISNSLMPRLSEAQLARFVELIDNPETPSDAWKNFWHSSIPDFDLELKKILTEFGIEMKVLLA